MDERPSPFHSRLCSLVPISLSFSHLSVCSQSPVHMPPRSLPRSPSMSSMIPSPFSLASLALFLCLPPLSLFYLLIMVPRRSQGYKRGRKKEKKKKSIVCAEPVGGERKEKKKIFGHSTLTLIPVQPSDRPPAGRASSSSHTRRRRRTSPARSGGRSSRGHRRSP